MSRQGPEEFACLEDGTGSAQVASVPAPGRSRGLLFGALCFACLLLGGSYAAIAVRRDSPAVLSSRSSAGAAAASVSGAHLMFLDSDGDAFRRISTAPLASADPGAARQVSDV